MEIKSDCAFHDEPVPCRAIRYVPGGEPAQVCTYVQKENFLTIDVEGALKMRVGCSANRLVELVIGRLFTEGIIADLTDVNTINFTESSRTVQVSLNRREWAQTDEPLQTVPTTGTPAILEGRVPLAPVTPIEWTPEWIFEMSRLFAEDNTGHARTRGVHSAYLADYTGTLCCCEDIGRHNAFDKAVGWGLLNGVDLASCMIFTSGRVPTDMVTKAIRARIPLLATKAVPTADTVEISRRYNLTLIAAATPKHFDVMVQGR